MARYPLEGRQIVVTRPPYEADVLAGELDALGATTLIMPLVFIEKLEDTAVLAAAFTDLARYDWVVFTSANGVRATRRWLRAVDLSRGTRVAAVGPVTAARLRTLGVEPAFVPERFAADEIVAGLEPLSEARVLLPQADIADPGLAEELRSRGALVDAVAAYRTVEIERSPGELAELRAADAVVLMSGSAARSLSSQGGAGGALIVCIGSKTAEAAREAGLSVGLVAEEATADGIIQALVRHYEEHQP